MKVKEAETYIRTKVEKKKVNQGQKKENDNDGKMRKEKSGKERRKQTKVGGKSTAKVKVK